MKPSESENKRISGQFTDFEDEELVRLAKRQLPYVTTAYKVLFYRYYAKLTIVCFRYLGSHEEAEEAVSDTMLNMFNHLSQFEERSSFKTWIFKIAHNQALTRLRKKRVEQIQFDELALPEIEAANVQTEIGQGNLNQLLSRLNVEERSIVVFRIAGDLEFRDIALVVDQKLSTVKMRYKRALKKMAVKSNER